MGKQKTNLIGFSYFIFHAHTLTELKTAKKTKINWKLEEEQEEDPESL